MELRHLRYFVAVAEELHFGRAAKRLHIAQPALSTQIKRLENELNVELLLRTSRSVRLTEAGNAFLEEAYLSLDYSERAIRKARRVASGEVGRIQVGLVGSATYSIVTEVIRLFRSRFPEVLLTPHEMNTIPQVEALEDGHIDVGFLRLPSSQSCENLEVEAFVEEPLVAVLPTLHSLANSKQVTLDAISGEPFILADRLREPGMTEQVLDVCKEAGFVPDLVEETTELSVALGLIAAGVGMTLLPASAGNLKTTGVAYIPLAEPAPSVKLSVAWNKTSLTSSARSFLDFVRDFPNE